MILSTSAIVIIVAIVSALSSGINRYTVLFSLLCMVIGGWLSGFSFEYGAKDPETALSWFSQGYLFVPFIPAATYSFMSAFLEPTVSRKLKIVIIWMLSIFFMWMQYKYHAVFSTLYRYDWGFYNPHHLWFGLSFLFFLSMTMGLTTLEVFLAYRLIPKERTIKIARFRVLLLSLIIGSIGIVDFLPSYRIGSLPLGFIAILIFILLFFHAIHNLKILDLSRYVTEKIIDTMNDPLFVCDTDGIIHKVNNCTIALTQQEECRLLDHELQSFLLKTPPADNQSIVAYLQNKTCNKVFEGTLRSCEKHSIPVSVSESAITSKNTCYGWVIIAHDISDYKKYIEQLLHLSNHDYLTQIYNRKRFEELLDYHIKLSMRNNYESALLLFDIDDFKKINDTHGHPCGDQVLIEFSKRLRSCLRETDVLARLGGDEFAVLLPNIKGKNYNALVAKLLRAITNSPMVYEDTIISIKCSIGVTLIPEHGDNIESLIKHADLALYQCKRKHRHQ